MAEYRLSPRAQCDLDAILDHTATRWSLSQAMRYIDLVEAVCADLAEAPQRARGCDDIRLDYRRRGVGQHVIYFRPTGYGIAVIRILHQRMDVASHL